MGPGCPQDLIPSPGRPCTKMKVVLPGAEALEGGRRFVAGDLPEAETSLSESGLKVTPRLRVVCPGTDKQPLEG